MRDGGCWVGFSFVLGGDGGGGAKGWASIHLTFDVVNTAEDSHNTTRQSRGGFSWSGEFSFGVKSGMNFAAS
jgi:hypothetical protein